jgi:catechol 2,3-dioxygenase-like lactoylglutathione lyase family enzyme
MPPTLTSLDHLVLTVQDIEKTLAFYIHILGMSKTSFQPEDSPLRHALCFGEQKINLHEARAPFSPRARFATPGSADLCFLSQTPLPVWQTHLAAHDITIERGPIPRTGAHGPITSIYVRDPDGNLIEISNSVSPA